MELISAVYGAAAAAALFWLLMYYLIAKPRPGIHKPPPEAGGAWPLVGHLPLMSGRPSAGLRHVNLGNIADKIGPLFTIRIGVNRVAVVSSWEVVKELFTTNDAAVSSRPSIKAGQHMAYDYAMLGFSSYNAYWRELRKLVSVELLSSRRIELQRQVRVTETTHFINEIYSTWERERGGYGGGVVVDMKQWFGELTLNMMLMMVAGKRFHGGDHAEDARRCRQVMRDFFHYAGLVVPADALPYLGWMDLGGHEKKMKQVAKELDDVVGEWLVEHRKKAYSGEEKEQDFMDVMLSVVKREDLECEYDIDTIIKATCGTLIAGGNDTTTIVFIWALALLLNNPHVLKKALEELDKHVGKDRRVDESDINNLVYLQAITKETLRLYPPATLSGMRRLTEDCDVGGYRIPKGTWLTVNMWKLHRDPQVWSDPFEFRPERFLNGDNNVDVKGQDFEFIPFGAGRRICPATNFGMQTLHFVLASLLQAFEVSRVSHEAIDMSASTTGLTNMKATPLDVLIAPRLPPSLYN